jgi:CheY-like chemotaxis protein
VSDKPDLSGRQGWGAIDILAVWEASRGVLNDQVDIIERAVVACIEGRLGLERKREACREAHKLAGSLGSFGFRDASRLARDLEMGLAPSDLLDPSRALDLSSLVVALRMEIAQPPTAPTGFPADGDGPTLLVVDVDAGQARRVVEAAAGQGLRAVAMATLGAARELIATAASAVVVLVDASVGSEEDVAVFLAEMAGHDAGIATVVLVDHPGMSERVRAARAGARAVLLKPVPPDDVVQAVCRLLAREQASCTVLAVDDDPTFLVLISELLGARGLAVTSLDDPGRLWAVLESVRPDLLLLDNDMPGVDGISLCRAIRSDQRWARLPIVFLSGSESPEAVREMFTAGADDFVSKPLSGAGFVSRIVSRIERSRVQGERPDVDLATGLPSAVAFVRDASRLLGLARQDARPAVLAVVELDPPSEAALAAFGHRLRQASQAEDAVGAWSGGRLAVLLYGMTAPEAQACLGSVLHAARAEGAPRGPALDWPPVPKTGPTYGSSAWPPSRPSGGRAERGATPSSTTRPRARAGPRSSTCCWSTTTRR